jgi:DNA helicase-2/ATP-dependent DNA helicase PcrA
VQLNPEQQAAVDHRGSPLLVLAGAGTGKTRVITHRVAALLEEGVPAWRILAVTFTNKAAAEMRERMHKMCADIEGVEGLWVGTFHSIAARILRRHGTAVGLSRGFTIYDTEDQMKVMKRALKACNIDADQIAPRAVLTHLDRAKNRGLPISRLERLGLEEPILSFAKRAGLKYEQMVRGADAADFGDLLVLAVELLENAGQGRARLAAGRPRPGAGAQAAVLARGRRRVSGHEPGAGAAGRAAVGQGRAGGRRRRRPGDLRVARRGRVADPRVPRRAPGLPADPPRAELPQHRAHPAVRRRDHPQERGAPRQDAVERARRRGARAGQAAARRAGRGEVHRRPDLRRADRGHPGRGDRRVLPDARAVAGDRGGAGQQRGPLLGLRRAQLLRAAEIKDLLAYLRLLANPASDVDFERIINVPARKIGDTTVAKLREYAGGRGHLAAGRARQARRGRSDGAGHGRVPQAARLS